MQAKKLNEEVFFVKSTIANFARDYIEFLKKEVQKNKSGRIRLCAHNDVTDLLHEMFIVHTKDVYVRPHKHRNKCESFHIIEGQADLVVFNDTGDIVDVTKLGDFASGQNFYYRISNPCYHTLLINSEFLVFHETTTGPFNKSETIFAPWSPDDNNLEAKKLFLEQLNRSVEIFNSMGKL